CAGMTIYIGGFVVKFFPGLVQHPDPALHISASAAVNKRMTTIENEIATVNDVRFLKMNKTVAIRVACSIIIQAYIFFIEFLAPGIRVGLVRIQLLVLILILLC